MSTGSEPSPKLHPTVLDTGVIQVARVYASALHDAAARANQLDAVIAEYESLLDDVLARHPDFQRLLESSIIGRAEKADTIRNVFDGRASSLMLNYLLVLNDHGRMELIRPVLGELKAIRDQRLGRVAVQIRSAVPLHAADEKALRELLAAIVQGQPVMHSEVDPDLLGGLVIRVGDTVFDGSLRTRMRRLRELLLQRSTHEIQSRRNQFSSAT